ncbi:MAG: hypothetical protein IH920_03635 [Chloroflexi bacterium]|nr:hypothetical protein [Chloroflexota bacterium]
MRKNWLLIGIGLVVAVLAVAAVACDDDDDDDGGGGDGADGAAALTATLSEVEGNGVTGSATLTETDDGATQVVVTMEALPEGPHANHLHHGTCDAQGEVHVTLTELQAGADGVEASTTDFPEEDPDPEFSHFETGHYVAVHAADGAVISCGDVT